MDSNVENDFMSKTGTVLKMASTFVDSWKAPNMDVDPKKCLMERKEETEMENCTPELKTKAGEMCTKLLDNPKFKNCLRMFDRKALLTSCMADYCQCSDKINPEKCTCAGISVLASDCQFQGIMLDHGWRDMEFCGIFKFSFLKKQI